MKYIVVIPHTQQGQSALRLTTSNRNVARSAVLLGKENKLEVTVTQEVEPRPIKFKNL